MSAFYAELGSCDAIGILNSDMENTKSAKKVFSTLSGQRHVLRIFKRCRHMIFIIQLAFYIIYRGMKYFQKLQGASDKTAFDKSNWGFNVPHRILVMTLIYYYRDGGSIEITVIFYYDKYSCTFFSSISVTYSAPTGDSSTHIFRFKSTVVQ